MKTSGRLLVMTSPAILAAGMVCAGANEWSNIGPGSAGVALLAFDPHDSATIYAAAGTGVFKSKDGGSTWSNTGLLGWGVNNLLIHPQNTSVLYAQAAFSPDDNTDITKIFKSTDGGASWNDMVTNARLMALDPQDANTVYALAGGFPQGLFKSTDGGGNWARLDGIPANLVPVGLAIDPQNPATLYAPVQGNSGGRTVATIFKSTDGGASWRESVAGLPSTFVPDNGVPNALIFAPGGLTVDPKNPSTLYATKFLTGVYKSTDGGASWRAANFGMPNNPNDFPPCCSFGVVIDPQNPNTLYTPGGNPTNLIIYKSTNGGLSWSGITSLGAVGFTPLTIDPQGALYTAGGGGMRKSADGGATWSPVNFTLRATPISSLAIDPQNSGTFYAGNFKSTDGGMSWYTATFGIKQGYPISALAIDPQTPSTLYAGTGDTDCEYADLAGVYTSVDGGMNWVDTHAGAGCVSAIAVDPENPATVYAAGTHTGISKSIDGGISWSAASSGLPGGRLNAVTVDPKNSGNVYAASYRGLFQTKDGGATWSSAGLMSEVYALAIDPQNTGTLYAATATGLFQSGDGGATWSNAGLMSGAYAVILNPQAGTIYAGTDTGVFQSTDGEATWAPIPGGPDHARLLAPDPHDPNTIYAGGAGGLFTISLSPAIPAARPSAAKPSLVDRRESGRIPAR